ncbi:MAG: hypothetical protein WCD26_12435, partial [Pseudolabrys sp.]
MGPCARTVGNVDGIGQSPQWKRFSQQFGTISRHRRRHFRSDYKAPGTQLVLQVGKHPTQVAKSSGRCKGNNGKKVIGINAA